MLESSGRMMGMECPLEPPPGHNTHPHHPHPHQAHSLVSHTPSISSGASTAGGGRVRFIRLIRRRNESYGFSLRGGLEHGTGFFISHVEVGSEAFMQGLRAGDQLLRVNNLSVDQAIHREVTAMVQSKSSVILKVKSAGIIPVKEHRGDPLTWLVIDDDEEEEIEEAEDEELETDFSDPVGDSYSQSIPSSSSGASQHHHHHHHHHQHHPGGAASSSSNSSGSASANDCYARVVIPSGGKAGLGCSICKGPAEKPGIFVQSVRAGGVARNAGLRPGDQILACNDISFTHLEFAEAVYVLKSSPRLVLDVLRGAGLDFVAGESSGYNSSASSVAGDQTPPSSSSDPRDSDHSVTSRLSAVSQHLTLDRSRGWREIEAEWADAELAEKRRQLQSAQRNLKTRAQRDANHRLSASGSRSLCNLSAALREEDDNEQCTAFRDAGFAYTHAAPSTPHLATPHIPPPNLYKTALRSTRSSSDVTDDTSHKIALVTSADPHVNNIVVTGGPKDERDAVSRLEQLSSPSASRTSTLSSGTSQVTVRSSSGSVASASAGSKSCAPLPPPLQQQQQHHQESVVEQQLRELREEQKRLKEEADRLAEERRKFEEERRRGIERTQSAPLAPLVINCPGQTSLPPSLLQSPPSPTSSISSGRHTTRVIIKSPPPPPPPRKNTTTLTSRPNHSHQHHLQQQQQQRVSPPASPAHSSSSSSGVGSLCGSGAPPRRCKSIGSLSASSSESTVWEDLPSSSNHSNHLHHHHQNQHNLLNHQHHLNHQQLSASVSNNIHINSNGNIPPDCNFRSNMPPPPPPKPSAPLISPTQGNTNEPQTTMMLGGVPPPPPPPPPQPASSNHQSSLAAALSRELERRNAQEAQSGVNGGADDEVKAKVIQDKIEAFKKDKQKTIANDPKRAQHDKLMEEFKLAHKRMFVTKADSAEDTVDEKPLAKLPSHQKLSRAPTNNLPVNSRIIDRLNQNMSVNKVGSNAVSNGNSTNISNSKVAASANSKSSHIVIDGTTSVNKWKEMLNSVPAASSKVNSPPASTTKESQQNERSGGTTSKPSVLTKPPLRPTPGNSVVMEEFRPGEKQSPRVSPPSSYFEVQKETSAKPLVSIGTYPSPNNRPAPVKMDFLPSTSSVNVEVNGTTKQNSSPRDKLQNELTSTLTRSNIRQRLNAQELPLDPTSSSTSSSISETSSSPSKGISATFTTTTIQNNSTSPGASLSNKYRGIGQDAPSVNNSEGRR